MFPFHSGDLGVEGVFARRCAIVRNRAASIFFPASPASGSVPVPLLREVPRKFSWILQCSSTCPILPQCVLQMSSRAMDTDRFAVMFCICRDAKFKFSKRAGNRKYVTTGPHVCNMLCNIVEVVTHRPIGSNQPQPNSSDSAGIAL